MDQQTDTRIIANVSYNAMAARKEIRLAHRKTPPYGRTLREMINSGKRPKCPVWVFIGNHAWQRASLYSQDSPDTTLVLPPWLCPTEYSWPVRGCNVLIVDTAFCEADYLNDTIASLLRDGAACVHASGRGFEFITVKPKRLPRWK